MQLTCLHYLVDIITKKYNVWINTQMHLLYKLLYVSCPKLVQLPVFFCLFWKKRQSVSRVGWKNRQCLQYYTIHHSMSNTTLINLLCENIKCHHSHVKIKQENDGRSKSVKRCQRVFVRQTVPLDPHVQENLNFSCLA